MLHGAMMVALGGVNAECVRAHFLWEQTPHLLYCVVNSKGRKNDVNLCELCRWLH